MGNPIVIPLDEILAAIAALSDKVDALPSQTGQTVDLSPIMTALDAVQSAIATLDDKVDALPTVALFDLRTSAIQSAINDRPTASEIEAQFGALASAIAALSAKVDAIDCSGGGTGPEEPTGPDYSQGDVPLVGVNVRGIGNNGWRWLIPGYTPSFPTDARLIEDKYLAPLVANLPAGKPWFARVPVMSEQLVQGQGQALRESFITSLIIHLDRIHARGGKVLLECHNYFRRWAIVPAGTADAMSVTVSTGTYLFKEDIIGTGVAANFSIDGLVNMFYKLAQDTRISQHPALWGIGIQNEPHDMDFSSQVLPWSQQLIDALRNGGYQGNISVCGTAWASAKQWVAQSDGLRTLTDSAGPGRLYFEAHQYADNNGDGGGQWANPNETIDPQRGVIDCKPFFDWLEQYNLKGILGEFGYPVTAGNGNEYASNLIDEANSRGVIAVQWSLGPGMTEDDPNSMSVDATGALKANATPVVERIGRTRV